MHFTVQIYLRAFYLKKKKKGNLTFRRLKQKNHRLKGTLELLSETGIYSVE